MYTDEMMKEAVEHFLKNPSYIDEYEKAPSEACKKRIAFTFCFSLYDSDEYFDSLEDFWAERDRLLSQLDLADWKHLLKYSGVNPWRVKCMKKIKELEEAQQ